MLNKTEIANKVTRTFHKAAFKVKKHSPEILVVAGVVGVVGATVMACKATLKVNEINDEAKNNLEKIHIAGEKGITEAGEVYTEEDVKKETAIVYVQTAYKYTKLYAPALIVGGLSVTAILAGHNMTRKRNVALAAAYTALETSFKDYRGRVVERFGEALDKELRYNIKTKEIEHVMTNEDGSETIVKEDVEVADVLNMYSEYAKFFDDGCTGWSKDPEYNLVFLRQQQRCANDRLKAHGYLFLNDVYDMLGIGRTPAGQLVGWIYDEKNPIGDNYVDFGIYDMYKPKCRDFVNGYERSILLDFNVDGKIYDKI